MKTLTLQANMLHQNQQKMLRAAGPTTRRFGCDDAVPDPLGHWSRPQLFGSSRQIDQPSDAERVDASEVGVCVGSGVGIAIAGLQMHLGSAGISVRIMIARVQMHLGSAGSGVSR